MIWSEIRINFLFILLQTHTSLNNSTVASLWLTNNGLLGGKPQSVDLLLPNIQDCLLTTKQPGHKNSTRSIRSSIVNCMISTITVLEITVSHWPFSDQFQHLDFDWPNLLYIFNGMAIDNLQKCPIFKKWPTNF